jgi:hypothetical protein
VITSGDRESNRLRRHPALRSRASLSAGIESVTPDEAPVRRGESAKDLNRPGSAAC